MSDLDTMTPEVVPEQATQPTEADPKPDQIQAQEEKTFTQKELDEILQKRIAKAEAKAERRVLRTLERIAPQPVREQQPTANDEPQREHYASDAQYLRAMVDHEIGRRDAMQHQARAAERNAHMAKTTERLYADAEKLDGFDRDVFDELPLTPHIAHALVESDVAAQLMAHFTRNPDDVERIAGLSPARQAVEIGKIEAKLSAKPSLPSPSKAAKPLEQARGVAKTGAPDPNDSAAWIRYQNDRDRSIYRGKS